MIDMKTYILNVYYFDRRNDNHSDCMTAFCSTEDKINSVVEKHLLALDKLGYYVIDAHLSVVDSATHIKDYGLFEESYW